MKDLEKTLADERGVISQQKDDLEDLKRQIKELRDNEKRNEEHNRHKAAEVDNLNFRLLCKDKDLDEAKARSEEKKRALEEAKARSDEKRRRIEKLEAALVGKGDALLLSPHKPNLLTKRSSAQKVKDVKRTLFTNTKR